jgi:transcriptional regulator with XRE-family HTH domain
MERHHRAGSANSVATFRLNPTSVGTANRRQQFRYHGIVSIMPDNAEHELNRRIGERVRALRASKGLTLDALAEHGGVSRSMISSVERAESSPTAVLLERLAAGLGIPLASLFDIPLRNSEAVARLADQQRWRDPASGYVRRNVSPSGFASPIQIVEVEFPPGARVAYETSARDVCVHQQLWVLEGEIDVRVADGWHHLYTGDCLAFVLDRPTAFHNPTRKTARYAAVIVSQPDHRR